MGIWIIRWEFVEEVVTEGLVGGINYLLLFPLAIDLDMWLNTVNVKPPYLIDLEIDNM